MSNPVAVWERAFDWCSTKMAPRLLQNLRYYLRIDVTIIVVALLPIYVGAHAALTRPTSAGRAVKEERASHSSCDDEDDQGPSALAVEGSKLQASDAVLLPVFAGAILTLFYWIITSSEDGAKILSQVLGVHVALTGTMFLRTFLNDSGKLLRSLFLPTRYTFAGKYWVARQDHRQFVASDGSGVCASPLPGLFRYIPNVGCLHATLWRIRHVLYRRVEFCLQIRKALSIKTTLTIVDLLSSLGSLTIIYYFSFVHKYWWLTNLIGIASAYGAVALMSPSTFSTGSLILSGLFFYDIYMVFYTPMMVTVATRLDIPAKLLFPKSKAKDQGDGTRPMSMLGLGDIVIPGMMIALALKFDLYLFYLRKQRKRETEHGEVVEKAPYINATGHWGERFWCKTLAMPATERVKADARAFPKTYFNASILGYVVAMLTCGFWMAVYKHPQPALLYLVPGVLGAVWGTALFKGDLRTMLEYSDTGDTEEDDSGRKTGNEKRRGKGGHEEEKIEGMNHAKDQLRQPKRRISWLLSLLWNRTGNDGEDAGRSSTSKKDSERQPDPTKPTYLIRFYLRVPPKKGHTVAKKGMDAHGEPGSISGQDNKSLNTLEYVSIDNTARVDAKEGSAPKRRKTGGARD